LTPRQVTDFGKSKKIATVKAGSHHTIIHTQSGDIYACGSNKDGQLGTGDKESRATFTLLKSLDDKNIYRIFAGGNHTWILLDEFIPTRKPHR